MNTVYTARERFALWLLGAGGLVGLNGAFVYGLIVSPGSLRAALSNPVAVAFILEALALVVVLAYLLGKWGLLRIRWGWFVVLSLLGGLAFALPVALLWRQPRDGNR